METPARPDALNRAFTLWLVVGVPLVLLLVGIVIVAAAFNLRAGYRGARVMLTAIAVMGATTAVLRVAAFAVVPDVPAAAALFAVPGLVFGALVVTATVLMWRPEVTEHFRVLREGA